MDGLWAWWLKAGPDWQVATTAHRRIHPVRSSCVLMDVNRPRWLIYSDYLKDLEPVWTKAYKRNDLFFNYFFFSFIFSISHASRDAQTDGPGWTDPIK